MRLHVLGLPHTSLTRAYEWCAFTARTRTFAQMMAREGWDVTVYGGPDADVTPAQHVPVVTRDEQGAWWPGWDMARDVWPGGWDPDLPYWQAFNERAIAAIRERSAPGDVLCLTMGTSHRPVADALPHLYPVESGIGYHGVWAPFRVYESHALRQWIAGRDGTDDCRFYDAVIPRAWDPVDFPAGKGDGGYALFVGRFVRRKGIEIAVEATRRAGVRLIMAGQGCEQDGQTFRGTDIEVSGSHLEHVGTVGPEERARLMGGAVALLSPSIYLEPLGGVHIEAMLTGTPVITTDWGVYPETVQDGVNGCRGRLLRDFVAGLEQSPFLDRRRIRAMAQARFSTDAVAPQFTRYFDDLRTLAGDGWYAYPQRPEEVAA